MRDTEGQQFEPSRIEPSYRAAERFIAIADTLLQKSLSLTNPICLQQSKEWASDDAENFYILTKYSDATQNVYALEVYGEDDHNSPSEIYGVGPETNGHIRELNFDYTVIDEPDINNAATIEVLAIVTEAAPHFAAENFDAHIKKDFYQLAGSFILSDRTVERNLDKALKLRYEANRQVFIQRAINLALTKYQSSLDKIVNEVHGLQGTTEMGRDIKKAHYQKIFQSIGEVAVEEFAQSKARLRRRLT